MEKLIISKMSNGFPLRDKDRSYYFMDVILRDAKAIKDYSKLRMGYPAATLTL